MPRYIDADVVMKELSKLFASNGGMINQWLQNAIEDTVEETPTVDAERHGHWEYLYDENYKCSECGDWWVFIEGTPKDNGANFCPHCGARMDEEEDDGETN